MTLREAVRCGKSRPVVWTRRVGATTMADIRDCLALAVLIAFVTVLLLVTP